MASQADPHDTSGDVPLLEGVHERISLMQFLSTRKSCANAEHFAQSPIGKMGKLGVAGCEQCAQRLGAGLRLKF
jgi:hypothetical protein